MSRSKSQTNPIPPPSNSAFDPDTFLKQHNIENVLNDMFQSLLHYRPADPIVFVRDYLSCLAQEEDERFQSELLLTSGLNPPSKKKSSKQQTELVVEPEVPAPKQSGVTQLQLMCLKMEMERFTTSQNSKRTERLHELLADSFVSMSERGKEGTGLVNLVDVEDVEELLVNLSESMSVPRRASDQLIQEVRRETKDGKVTFAQFCGAGRSLAMLPSFLEEAERLCAKLNGRPSPARHNNSWGEVSPGKTQMKMRHGGTGSELESGIVDAESLLGALPEEAWGSGEGKDVGLKEGLMYLLGQRHDLNQLGVFDLISATIVGGSAIRRDADGDDEEE
ncbi:hypothetical protein TrST_g9362 [Triparma strigata]|uniref:RIIa domain-containing protein n=1 Tax=Triparma strigata TaxID=1606541 RepID=A0A9W7BZN1_9STRA|nr:hypothetical protein TrST_g9362 [Triparma strigata]